ncbi:MAG: caspase family protein [Rhizobiaceae bacterium]|nr:caspase family protein [Rhizobiaceae bacterium]
MLLAAGVLTAEFASAQEPDPFAAYSMPVLAWQDEDDAASYVARSREAASPLGGECEAERQALGALAGALQVGADQAGTAGKPLVFEWAAGVANAGVPAWLVVSVDGPVRFTGEGFYALTPGAVGPFGLPDGEDRTRALVALFGTDAPRGGSFGIVPLRAGPLHLTVSLAGFVRRCGEEWSQVVASGSIPVSVSAEAVFSVRDPFSFDAPRQVIASPDGATSVELFDGRYRLIDRASGAVLADREGRDPRYSPTGRFLVALMSEGYELLDAADGTVLGTGTSGDIAWENSDSFMVVGEPMSGRVVVRNAPVEGRAFEAVLDCTVCAGMGTRLNVDLENDLVLRVGGQGFALARLGGSGEVAGMIDIFEESIMADALEAIAAAASATGAAPMLIPPHWNLRGGLRFSFLAEDYEPTGFADFDLWLERMKKAVQPVVEEAQDETPSPERLQPTEIGQGRGASALARPKAVPDRMPTRLAEFGIEADAPLAPAFRKSGRPDEQEDLAIAARIEASVPWARGLFQPMEFGCLPDDEDKIYAFFDDVAEFAVGERRVWLTLFSCKWTAGGPFEHNFYLLDSAAPGLVRLGAANADQPNGGRCDSGIAACGFEASLFGDRYLLVWSRPSQAFLLYDLATQRVVSERYRLGRGELLREMRYSVERDAVVQINADDSFFVHDASAGTTLLEGRYVDDEIVAWSPDLRFDATAEGANYVGLRFPGQPGEFTFQQFRRQLSAPGHVREVMERRYAVGAAAVQVPPGLSGSIEVDGERLVGSLDLRDAVELRIYQDGLRTDTLALDAGSGRADFDVARVAGARWVSVVATDRSGLVSRPIGRELSGEAASRPRLHALTVGVDRYDARELADLRFAGADARTLRDAFSALGGRSLELGTLASLTDDEATPGAVLEKARQIVAAAGEGETVVFSFAGHGLTGPDGRFYMATGATDPQALETTALAWEDLAGVLKQARARVVVFLDACHSGAAGTGLFATNDQAAEGLLDQVPSGLLVFSAAKGRQLSEEIAQLGGGVFSNAVADVIARRRAAYDLDGNGAIEASELYAGVKRRVSELTDDRQVPWLARNELIGDFALF